MSRRDRLAQKVRVRSDEELEARLVDLVAATRALDRTGVDWRLSCGALLGAVRGRDFVPWDWDVEIYVRSEDARPRADRIDAELRAAGFEVKGSDAEGAWERLCRRDGGDRIGVHGFDLLPDGDGGVHRRRRRYNHPADLWDGDAAMIELRGWHFRTFSDPERFLEYSYGEDWQTPLRTADKRVYLTEVFRGRRYP